MCAVMGVPDKKWGEVGKAYIVLKRDSTATEADIMAHLQHHLAGFKVPRFIEFRSSLPISGAGKILKRVLAQPETAVQEEA